MRNRLSIVLLTGFAGILGTVAAASGQSRRLKDEDVRKLMEEAKKDVERFTDAVEQRGHHECRDSPRYRRKSKRLNLV